MFIKTFPSGPLSTNAYLVACEETKQAAVIDPSQGSTAPILDILKENQFTCDKILLTHSHWDHIADVAELKRKTGAPVYVHALDAANLENPGADGLPLFIPIEGVIPDYDLNDGDSVKVGHLIFSVIHTPGHSPGCVCFYNEKNKILFSGDTLFKKSIGKVSFPTSRPDLIWTSIAKLIKLPSDIKVYSGHGDSTLIGDEVPWLSRSIERNA